MLKITTYVVGEIYTNCYLVEDIDTGKLLVVDPGGKSSKLVDQIKNRGGKLEYILLTHAHFDHVSFVHCLQEMFNPIVCCGEYEKELVGDNVKNCAMDLNIKVDDFSVSKYLKDGEVISFGNSLITYMHTPGHTVGSGIYIVDDVIFSGDTVFCGSVGRTDFPTSSMSDMMKSINKISNLDGEFKILPGHDRTTTLSYERKHNPFFR